MGQTHWHCIRYLLRSVRKEKDDVLDLMSVLMRVLYHLMILVSVVLMHVSSESCLMYALMILVVVWFLSSYTMFCVCDSSAVARATCMQNGFELLETSKARLFGKRGHRCG